MSHPPSDPPFSQPTYPQYPPTHAPTPKRSRKWIGPAVCFSLVLILIFVAFGTAWWQVEYRAATPEAGTATAEFSVTEIRVETKGEAQETKATIDMETVENAAKDAGRDGSRMKAVMDTTLGLLFLAFVFIMIGIVLVILAGRGKIRVGAAIAVSVLALLLLLATIAHFAVSWPAAFNEDQSLFLQNAQLRENGSVIALFEIDTFIGDNTTTIGTVDVSATWAPNFGWVVSIVAFFFTLGATGSMIARRKKYPKSRHKHTNVTWSPPQTTADAAPDTSGTPGAGISPQPDPRPPAVDQPYPEPSDRYPGAPPSAPNAPPQPLQYQPPSTATAPSCPTCGRPMEYNQSLEQWICYECQGY